MPYTVTYKKRIFHFGKGKDAFHTKREAKLLLNAYKHAHPRVSKSFKIKKLRY